MNILLTPDLNAWVEEQVKMGSYLCATEVICEALHLLQDREAVQRQKLNSLRTDIKLAIDELDTGRYTVFDSNFVDHLVVEAGQASNPSAL